MIARCRRNPIRTSSPFPVGHIVGKTGVGVVAGAGRPTSLDAPHVGIFVSWRGGTKSPPRG